MIRWAKEAALSFGALVLTACSPLTALDLLVPSDSYTAMTGIAYGALPRQKLDVYTPRAGKGPFPVVVFFYGGSWRWGERDQYRFVGEALARRGIVTVVPDYRLYPKVRFPAFVEDGAAAVAWAIDNVERFGGDGSRLFVAGHSAGAHTGALLALDRRYLEAVGKAPEQLCGFAGLAGPYSFDPTEFDSVRAIFEHLPDPDVSRPVTYARAGAPPMLLLHGAGDTTVYPLNTLRLAEAMRESGGTVDADLLPDIGHYRIIASLAKPFEHIAPVADRLAAFVRKGRSC